MVVIVVGKKWSPQNVHTQIPGTVRTFPYMGSHQMGPHALKAEKEK